MGMRVAIRTGLGVALAAASLCAGPLHVVRAQAPRAAPAARVNCSGYVAGMEVLVRDVGTFANRAPSMRSAAAADGERGLLNELHTVLHANGKPVDNFKVVIMVRDAVTSVVSAIDARDADRDPNAYTGLLGNARTDLSYAQTLLNEICLPSKVKRLPCSGTCVVSLVGSGRVRAGELPPQWFIAPTNSVVRYAWNCQKASEMGKGIVIDFQDYSEGLTLPSSSVLPVADAIGVAGARTVLRDLANPTRVRLLVNVEQACSWQMTVVRQ